MDDPESDVYARFVRRFRAIEAEVMDPPPFTFQDRAVPRLVSRRRSWTGLVAVVGLACAVAAFGPLIAGRPRPGSEASSPAQVAASGDSSSWLPANAPETAQIVTVDGWSATCLEVESETCRRVALLAINNLGRNRPAGVLTVQNRRSCLMVPSWADGTRCWQADIPVGTGSVCMVIARRTSDGTYAQVAGDVPGRAHLPTDPGGCPP